MAKMRSIKEIIDDLKCCCAGSCSLCGYTKNSICREGLLNETVVLLQSMKENEVRPYWKNITAINLRQEAKGRDKYGQDLEENDTMPTDQRIEHIQEELIDALKYLEHFKAVASHDGMTTNDYQRAALRTAWTKTNEDLPVKILAMKESGAFDKNELLLLNGVLGLSGESGEASDLVKKWIFQGHDLVHQQLAEELCDVAWYLAISAHALGYTLDDIFQMNVEKLMERYPDGFSKERSIHR